MILFPDRINRICMDEAIFEGKSFYRFSVTFYATIPHVLPNFVVLRFGIPESADLNPLRNWFSTHAIEIQCSTASDVRAS